MATQASLAETVRRRGVPSEADAPSPHPAGGVAPPLKQVASHAAGPAMCSRFGCASVRGTLWEGSWGAGWSDRECRGAVRNLCGQMTGTAVYEVRRARTREELAAALELRHEVFCVEQGVPERDELDGRDHEGIHLVAVRDGEPLATCRIVLVGSDSQFSRLAVRRSAAPAGDRDRAARARRRGVAPPVARGGSCSMPRPTLASLYEQAGYRPRAGSSGRPGSSTSRWRSCSTERPGRAPSMPEIRIDPLTGLRAIVAGDRADRPGGGLSATAGAAARPRDRSVRRGSRGPHPARALRGAARTAASPTRPVGPCGSCPTCTRRSARTHRDARARGQPRPVLGGAGARGPRGDRQRARVR